MFDLIDTSDLEYPKELEGFWCHIVLFKDHPNPNIDGIGSIYFNDKYPSGSTFVGDYILNDYPDGYITIRKINNKKYASGRIFISPLFRKRGIASAATGYYATLMKHKFNIKMVHLSGSEIANKATLNASKLFGINFGSAKIEKGIHMNKEFFDQPIRPYLFFGRRIST